MNPRKIWLWRAWVNTERIADCGIARAHTKDEARAVAALCLGGPWMRDVTHYTVEQIPGVVDDSSSGAV